MAAMAKQNRLISLSEYDHLTTVTLRCVLDHPGMTSSCMYSVLG